MYGITRYEDLRASLLSRGLRRGLPERPRDAAAERLARDAELIAESECEICRLMRLDLTSLRLEAWTDGEGEYVAVTVCRLCGHAAEF